MADTNFTDADFQEQVLKSDLPVVVDFWAPWCGPCRVVSPTIDELAKDYAGKVKVGKMNVDDNPEVAGQYGIMSIPSVLIFKGGEPVKTLVGAKGKDSYKNAIDEVISS